jgi:hypothetical protein
MAKYEDEGERDAEGARVEFSAVAPTSCTKMMLTGKTSISNVGPLEDRTAKRQ